MPEPTAHPGTAPLVLGAAAAALGAAVLAGWALDVPWLKSGLPGLVTTKANTAAGMLVLGTVLAVLARGPAHPVARRGVLGTSVAAIVFALSILSQDLFGWTLGMDEWLFRDVPDAIESSSPGRMSPATAFCFVLVGAACALMAAAGSSRHRFPMVLALSAVVCVTGFLALSSHASGLLLGVRWWNYAGMAMPTALGFVLLGSGLFVLAARSAPLRWSLDALLTAGFVIGIASLLLTTAVSFHFTSRLYREVVSVAQTNEALREIKAVESMMAELESQQRGYIITGDEWLLQRRHALAAEARRHLESFGRLTADNPEQRLRRERLATLVESRLDWAERTIAARKDAGFDAARELLATGHGYALTDDIKGVIDDIETDEYELLQQRRTQSAAISGMTFFVLPLSLCLSLVILFTGLFFLNLRVGERARALRELRASESRMRLFVEYAPAAIAMLDRNMRYVAVSRRWLDDYRLADRQIVGHSHYEVFPEIPEPWRETHRRCLAGAIEKSARDPFPRADGSLDWVRWEIHPWHDDAGEIGGIILFSELITGQVDAEERIRRLNRVYAVLSSVNSLIIRVQDRQELFDEACRIAVEHGNFGIAWIGKFDAEKLEVIPVASAGLPEDSELRTTTLSIASDVPQYGSVLGIAIREGRAICSNDITLGIETGGKRRHEAVRRGYRSVVALPLIVGGKVVGNMSLFAREIGFFDAEEMRLLNELAGDISFALENLDKQERLDYISYNDVLTGLPNRTLFIDRLGQQLHARGGDPRMVAVVLFDLERFRNINDTLGRRGGDRLLRLVAQRLETAFKSKDYLARIAADGFGVMVRGLRDAAEIAHVVENQILACVRQPFEIDGMELRIAAKAGIALFPIDGRDGDTLFRNAEAALKKAKLSTERYTFYAAEMNAQAEHLLQLETRLREAVEKQQFVLHYQTKVDLASGEIRGLEALIRWQEPGGKLVPPGSFIPFLEESGLILDVGKWAIRQALRDARGWATRGCAAPRIAVNVSAVQLQRRDFTDVVIDAVQEAGDVPEALELEITESLLMKDMESSIRKLSLLRGLGIHIAMDDFGTGYSSLSYITRLPIDSLKIDRAFIRGMADSAQDLAIVKTIITLAHSVRLKVVAEGVETEEQAHLLASLGCDEAQGYLYSKPMPAAQLEPLLCGAPA